MRTSTKIFFVLFVITFVPGIFLGNYLLAAIIPTGEGFVFSFTPLAWVALAFNIVSNVFLTILFFRFLKTQRLANSLFFSLIPLTLTYSVFMVYIVGVKNMTGVVAESVRATLNIQTEQSSYNNFLWAGLATLVYLIAIFVIILFACRPLSKVAKATEKLGDGRTKNDTIQVGGGKQFKEIENSLNKINYSFKEKENKLKQTNLQMQKLLPRQLFKFFDKTEIEQLEFGNQVTKTATTLFCDLKSLNSSAKTLSLEENFNYINSYLKVVSPLIKRFNGFIDKYLGEGVLAVFSRPQDAIECAHAILRSIAVKNKNQKGLPAIDGRIAINSGDVVFGIVSEDERKIPTILSDEVGLLTKMQEINTYISTKMLISKQAINSLPQNFDFDFRFTGDLSLEGDEQISLFESLNYYPKKKRDKLLKQKNRFEEGVRAYNEQDYETAKVCFEKVLKAVSDDKAAFVYFNKASEKIKNSAA